MQNLNESKIVGGENPCLVIDSTHVLFKYFEPFFDELAAYCESQCQPPKIFMQNGEIVPAS